MLLYIAVGTVLTAFDVALLSRSGLRLSHGLLPGFAKKLNDLFFVTWVRRDARILNAVVYIWRSICVDAELCRKLLQEGTYLFSMLFGAILTT